MGRAGPVSILLNVGTWTSFLSGSGAKINESLLSQESKFGNVISGQMVEKFFITNYQRDDFGRFSVAIPLNPSIEELGSSRDFALKRFSMLEKRFEKDPIFKQKYLEFIKEYELLGIGTYGIKRE